MTTSSFTAGERRLPGGRAALLLSLALLSASFRYPALGDGGESIQTVTCTLGDRTETTGARVVLP